MNRKPDDDKLLRSYLLGNLPEEDADRLEGRLLAEDDLFDLAEAIEADLLLAADRGGLVPEERERVMRRLASSPQGLERLALARSLNRVAAEKGEMDNVKPFLRRPTAPTLRWLALAASLIVLPGLVWFARHNQAHAPEVESNISGNTPPPIRPPGPEVAPAPPPVSPTPSQKPDEPPQKPRRPVPVAVMALSFMTSRGGESVEQLRLAPGTSKAAVVEFQIDAETLDADKSFSVVIRNDQGTTVWEKSGLRVKPLPGGEASALVVDVPARLLPPGSYEAAVIPAGEKELGATVFDVVQEEP